LNEIAPPRQLNRWTTWRLMMKRILISVLAGTALTFGSLIVAALVLYPGDRNAVGGLLLYWPLPLINKLGLGPSCANADSIADKLSCIRLCLIIDLVAYPVIICLCSCLIYVTVFRRGVRRGLAAIE
jgi:hypothetical protein